MNNIQSPETLYAYRTGDDRQPVGVRTGEYGTDNHLYALFTRPADALRFLACHAARHGTRLSVPSEVLEMPPLLALLRGRDEDLQPETLYAYRAGRDDGLSAAVGATFRNGSQVGSRIEGGFAVFTCLADAEMFMDFYAHGYGTSVMVMPSLGGPSC